MNQQPNTCYHQNQSSHFYVHQCIFKSFKINITQFTLSRVITMSIHHTMLLLKTVVDKIYYHL